MFWVSVCRNFERVLTARSKDLTLFHESVLTAHVTSRRMGCRRNSGRQYCLYATW